MLPRALLPVIWALSRVALARPATSSDIISLRNAEPEDDEEYFTEHIVFKRDDVPGPEDHQLAKRHGVDLNEMYKHSVFKRSSGDDYTIWVHNSWNENGLDDASSENKPDLETRQERTSLAASFMTATLPFRDPWTSSQTCNTDEYIRDTTNPNAPFTGGGNAIIRWADAARGYFIMGEYCCPDNKRVNLIIGGSNSGANMRFGIGISHSDWHKRTMVGSRDIGRLTRRVREFRRLYGNSWRMEGHGEMRCVNPEILFTQNSWVYWVLHRSEQRA